MTLFDYTKAFGKVSCLKLGDVLGMNGVPGHLKMRLIMNVLKLSPYSNTRISVKLGDQNCGRKCEINQEGRHRFPLSPAIFNFYIDDAIKNSRALKKSFYDL